MDILDSDGNGVIDWDEFVSFLSFPSKEMKKLVISLWNELSKDNPPSNMSCLYDSSLGRGHAISSFPPPPSIHESPKGCGYAGGINVTNINDVN